MNKYNMKIGITISFHETYSIWSNGIQLNALMLAETLKQCKDTEVCFLNIAKCPEEKYQWDTEEFPTYYLYDKFLEMDLLIFLGGRIQKEYSDHFKKDSNKKIIYYKCGNEFVVNMEKNIFGPDWQEGDRIENIYGCDDIWYVPQQEESNRHYFECLYRTPAKPVPFVYNPRWIKKECDKKEKLYKQSMFYSNTGASKRISIMEPNMNIVKYSLYPLMIAETYYRTFPENISTVNLVSGGRIGKKSNFLAMANTFDVKKDKKLFIEGRQITSSFLGNYSDILICHQILNPLNYIYLDAAYMEYPLIHNAELVSDLGYYYEKNNVKQGAKLLEEVIENHDKAENLKEYSIKNKKVLKRFNNLSKDMISQYERLLSNVMNGKSEDLKFNFMKNRYE